MLRKIYEEQQPDWLTLSKSNKLVNRINISKMYKGAKSFEGARENAYI